MPLTNKYKRKLWVTFLFFISYLEGVFYTFRVFFFNIRRHLQKKFYGDLERSQMCHTTKLRQSSVMFIIKILFTVRKIGMHSPQSSYV